MLFPATAIIIAVPREAQSGVLCVEHDPEKNKATGSERPEEHVTPANKRYCIEMIRGQHT